MTIEWDEEAIKDLENALVWISQNSYQNALMVETAILENIEKACQSPERFPKDKFRKSNDGNFRAFETHSFRITYMIEEETLVVLRIRHVKQNPELY
ncbi:MAG: type II toxin-antitoxin system RelE/ParE family toxin [Bacteroidota bacterium]